MADSDYTFVRKIKKGINENVAVVKKDGEEYISKTVRVTSFYFHQFLNNQELNEIDILTRLQHPNLLRAVDFIVKEESYYFILKLILYKADGDLSDYIESTAIPFKDRLRMIHQLGSGLHFLRTQHIIHCDIKPENILVKKSEGGRANVWLADFGLTRSEHSLVSNYDYCQTSNYRAPEHLYRDPDLWPYAFGPNQYVRVFKKEVGFPVSTSGGKMEGIYSNKKETIDLVGGEIWTFAWNALLILYNMDIKNFEKQIIANNGPRNLKSHDEYMDGYHYFIDILMDRPQDGDLGEYLLKRLGRPPFMDLEDPEDIGTAMKRKEEKEVYTDELRSILRELGLLLDLNTKTRPRTLGNFLECKTFCNLGLQCGVVMGKNHPYTNKNVADHYLMNTGSLAITSVYPDIIISPYELFLALELFHRVGPNFSTDLEKIKYTSIACLVLAESSITIDKPTQIEEWALFSDVNEDTLEGAIINIIRMTGGRIFDVSLYDLLPSSQLLEKAIVILQNRKLYEELGGVSGIADYLLKEETPDEIQKRHPRSEFSFRK